MAIQVKPAEGGTRKNRGCMWAIIVCAVLYVGGCVGFAMLVGSAFSSSTAKLDDKTVYRLDMKGTVVEQAQEENPFAAFAGSMPMANKPPRQ